MKVKTIQYKSAYNSKGKRVEIFQVNKDSNEKFTCLSCHQELIAKKGEYRADHFAHKSLTVNCSYETYLHNLAKDIFCEEYDKVKRRKTKFILEYNKKQFCDSLHSSTSYKCELGIKVDTINLVERLPIIKKEKRDGKFIPDFLLTDKKGEEKNKIYIEIVVTHKSDKEKIASDTKIIEFIIENEKDCNIFKTHKIPINHKKIIRHNFKTTSFTGDICGGNCTQHYKVLYVYTSGKSICKNHTLSEYAIAKAEHRCTYSEIVYQTNHKKDPFCSDVFFKKIIEVFKKKIPVKNCILCRYHAFDPFSSGKMFCKFLKRENSSNHAADCEYYKPDIKIADSYERFLK